MPRSYLTSLACGVQATISLTIPSSSKHLNIFHLYSCIDPNQVFTRVSIKCCLDVSLGSLPKWGGFNPLLSIYLFMYGNLVVKCFVSHLSFLISSHTYTFRVLQLSARGYKYLCRCLCFMYTSIYCLYLRYNDLLSES